MVLQADGAFAKQQALQDIYLLLSLYPQLKGRTEYEVERRIRTLKLLNKNIDDYSGRVNG